MLIMIVFDKFGLSWKYEKRVGLPFDMEEKLIVFVVRVRRYRILMLVCVSGLMIA